MIIGMRLFEMDFCLCCHLYWFNIIDSKRTVVSTSVTSLSVTSSIPSISGPSVFVDQEDNPIAEPSSNPDELNDSDDDGSDRDSGMEDTSVDKRIIKKSNGGKIVQKNNIAKKGSASVVYVLWFLYTFETRFLASPRVFRIAFSSLISPFVFVIVYGQCPLINLRSSERRGLDWEEVCFNIYGLSSDLC